MERESRFSPSAINASHLVRGSSIGRPSVPTLPMVPYDNHLPKTLPHLTSTSYISQPLNGGVCISSAYSSQTSVFSTRTSNNHSNEPSHFPWSTAFLQDILDLDDNIPVRNCPIQGGSGFAQENLTRQTGWSEWLPNDHGLLCGWSGLPGNASANEPKNQAVCSSTKSSSSFPVQHQPQPHQSFPSHSVEVTASTSSLSAGNVASTKQRMRWTPEKHERFVQAVSQLGGSEKATPKAVMNLMNCPDMTIYHVKSHLQKYRTARYRPELSEDLPKEKSTQIEKISSLDPNSGIGITEALRLQMELQKQLHEQLEIQRNLQLRIEEHGKYLQKMIENQCSNDEHNPGTPVVAEARSSELTCCEAGVDTIQTGKAITRSDKADPTGLDSKLKSKPDAGSSCKRARGPGADSSFISSVLN